MTWTDIVGFIFPYPTMFFIAVYLGNLIIRPSYYEDIDFILLLMMVGVLYICTVWVVLLNYGIETLDMTAIQRMAT